MKSIIQKTKVRRIFNSLGVQVTEESLEQINADFHRKVERMALNCRDGNVPRLKHTDMWIAEGKLSSRL